MMQKLAFLSALQRRTGTGGMLSRRIRRQRRKRVKRRRAARGRARRRRDARRSDTVQEREFRAPEIGRVGIAWLRSLRKRSLPTLTERNAVIDQTRGTQTQTQTRYNMKQCVLQEGVRDEPGLQKREGNRRWGKSVWGLCGH
jgi:hypothetical protein